MAKKIAKAFRNRPNNRLPFDSSGKQGVKQVDNLMNRSNNVSEEYMEAFRTNSFVEICSKIKSRWGSKRSSRSNTLSSIPSLPQDLHVSQCLIDPRLSTLPEIPFEDPDDEINQLLDIFFRISSEACKIYESMLRSIHQTRGNYNSMGRILDQLEHVSDNDKRNELYKKLASFALLPNPLATISQVQFRDIHNNLHLSLQQFTSRRRRMRRRWKLVQRFKKIAGGALIISCCALAVVVLVLAIHSAVGIFAVPGIAASSIGLSFKKIKNTKRVLSKTNCLKGFEAQLDTAAKGIYLLMNDFDTMSRLMTMLCDDIEHRKFIADLYFRRKSDEILKEVARDFQTNRDGVLSQLKELENHVYLCILNINRTRRVLSQQMLRSNEDTS